MDKLSSFIQTYDNVLDSDTCEQLIRLFEQNDQTVVRDNSVQQFDEVNMVTDQWPIVPQLQQIIQRYGETYRQQLNLDHSFPTRYGIEQFRMKRYQSNVGKFDNHVDISDYNSARRFLAFLFYLDHGDGGNTDFLSIDRTVISTVERKPGRLLVFPPMWMFLHRGQTPIDSTKYIISSYFHYL